MKKGDKIAGTRIIPLVIEKEKMERAKEAAEGGPIFRILPFHKKKTAIVTTGNEVFYGRIKDTFGPVVKEKIAEYPTEFLGQTLVDDQKEHIQEAILHYIDEGAELVLCTGGMSVDPDDCTPGAIAGTGANGNHLRSAGVAGSDASCWPIMRRMGKRFRSWACRAASCTQSGRSSIWCFRG